MISKFSVKKPYTVLVGVLLVIILGIVSISKMTTDLLPNMSLPYVVVVTTDPGASPQEVEKNVTSPIESAMATTSNIKTIMSRSYHNYSMVILEYEQNADMDSTIVEMRESLDQLEGSFEETVGTPLIMQMDPDMMPIMVVSADRKDMDSVEISRYVENELKPELESVEGVASVSATGAVEQSVEVTLNQKKIDALNKKIQKKIEEQFDGAQEKIDTAKTKISDGKEQLKQGQETMKQQATAAQSQISEKKQQLALAEDKLTQKLNEATQQKQMVEMLIKILQQASDTAQKQQTQKQPIDTLLANYDEKELEKMGQNVQALLKQQQDLQQSLNGVNELIKQYSGQFSQLGVSVNGYEDLPAAISQLSSLQIQLNSGIQTIQAAQEKVKEGKIGLDDAVNKINDEQIQASLQMSNAYADIAANEGKLDTAQQQLDEKKQTAVDAANVNDVLSVDTLNTLLKAQNFSMPAGYVTENNEQYLITVGDELKSADELEKMVLVDVGIEGIKPVRLSDVADVKTVDNSKNVYAKVDGNPAVMLSIEKQTGYSTGEVTDRLQKKFDTLMKAEKNLKLSVMMNQGIYIDMIVDSVVENMIMGAFLAVIILILFLKDIKPTIVIACSIPLSVIVAVVLMYFTGITLNIISLSGLALGIGMLVDNSIVVIENIYRLRNEGLSVKKAAIQGAFQVTGAIIASTLTTVCVFAPIIFTEGITRQLFVDMGLTIAYSLVASLIVALSFVPMMSSAVLHKTSEKQHPFMKKIEAVYEKILSLAMRWKPVVFLGVLILLAASVKLAMSRGSAFMPEMESTQATVTVSAKEKVKFEELKEMADQVTDVVSKIEDVDTIGAMAGGNNMLSGMSSGTPSSVTMYVLLKENPKLSNAQLKQEIEEKTKNLNCEVSVDTSSMDMSALTGSGITVRVKGRDLKKIQKIAKDVAKLVEKTEGTTDVFDGVEDVTKEFVVTVNKDKATKYGMTVGQVYQLIYGKMADTKSTTTISTDLNDYKVYVKNNEQAELTRDAIKKLKFTYKNQRTGKEKQIPLKKIVTFSEDEALNTICRESQERYVSVTASIKEGYNVGLVGKEVQKALDQYACPDGYTLEMKGENETIQDAMEQLVLMMVLAIAFIYLIMVAQFQSLLSPFIIMFTIPLAFTGGLFALYFTKNEISVIAMIGFVMLAGIIVNNGIVLVDHVNQLRREGMDKQEAILQSGKTRLRPILMTALTTICAMSTMALGIGSGSEMMQPMAIVTIGGLTYGTLLTLIVVPCIYDAFHRNKSMVEEEI
ncbi:MAG: efflux RND transporter permease subunit [Lachnospiraceae bacterium]